MLQKISMRISSFIRRHRNPDYERVAVSEIQEGDVVLIEPIFDAKARVISTQWTYFDYPSYARDEDSVYTFILELDVDGEIEKRVYHQYAALFRVKNQIAKDVEDFLAEF